MTTMSLLNIIVLICIGFVLWMVLFNKTAFKNFFSSINAKVGKAGRAAVNADPLAIYNQEIDERTEEIASAKETLASVQAQVMSLDRQTENYEKEKTRLENRIKAALSTGDKNNTAKIYAIELDSVEKNLEANKLQKQKTQEAYDRFISRIKSSQEKINAARQKAKQLGLDLKQSEKEKALASFTNSIDSSLNFNNKFTDIENAITERIDANRAAAEVSLSTSGTNFDEDNEAESDQRAEEILKRFQ